MPLVLLNLMGGQDIIVIALVVLVIFGAARIPQFMRGLGQGIKEFKGAIQDDDDSSKQLPAAQAAPRLTGPASVTWKAGTPQTANFVNNLGGLPTSWSWDFGGGCNPNLSTAEQPTVTPVGPGNYSCFVTGVNSLGNSTFGFQLVVTA